MILYLKKITIETRIRKDWSRTILKMFEKNNNIICHNMRNSTLMAFFKYCQETTSLKHCYTTK